MKKKDTINPMNLLWRCLLMLYVGVGLVLRVVLLFCLTDGASLSAGEVVRAFVVGAANDACMGVVLCLPLLLYDLGLNEWKYGKVAGGVILSLLAAAFCYVAFTHSVFHQYGGVVPRLALGLVSWLTVSFALRLFIPSWRLPWRRVAFIALWAVYVFLLMGNAVAEFFFWQEFGVRYNFIAVDYLVYTNEVVGNIMESYGAIPLLLVVIAVLTALFIWALLRGRRVRWTDIYSLWQQSLRELAGWGLGALCLLFLGVVSPRLEGDNMAANQLQQNGAYDFVEAFRSNELEYDRFYAMMDEAECQRIYRGLITSVDTIGVAWKECVGAVPQQGVNVVMVTVESLSASFMAHYGNAEGITPCLDALYDRSLVFDSLYAVGNRTVRGLEALSLCIPPSAGESIVKRKDNSMGSLSLGYVLRQRGYEVQFIYGGDSYFDNMGDFFGHNGYDVIDRKQMRSEEVTFDNIWGVCDEDLFRKALSVFDANRQPFFAQLMTVSNHRPYTFPEGKIAFEGDPKCRSGAVKYCDFAIGRFLREAEQHPWFDNTIFVIVADHCASSAGKTSIPVDKYHIPCIVYAPAMVKPCRVEKVCSQIDVVPTLLAMMHVEEPTEFAGCNILSDNFRERAFMATYQDLGYLEKGVLTVLSPKQRVEQLRVVTKADGKHSEEPMGRMDSCLVKHAQAYYQYVNVKGRIHP